MPLAIELAAARVTAMRPAEIAGLLDERFRLLTGGRADAAGRHQTLQATVEWSYALLSEGERHVFDCLGVFPASFDAAAAVDVAGAGGLQRWDILDSLTALVGKSMVAEEEGPDQTSRYHLLETMRAYARQQLAATGEQGRLQRRHAEHYAAFAERAGPELLGPQQLDWQHRIRAELDNLQAAGIWALAGSDQMRQLAFRIVAALAFAAISGRGTVGVWAERAVAHIGTCPPVLRANFIAAAAWSAYWAGGLELAQRRAEDALRHPASSDPDSLGLLRALLARIYALTGQPERGAAIAREGRQESAKRGIDVLVGYFLAMEALAWTAAGDCATARQPAMEAVEIARQVRNPALSATAAYTAATAIWLDEPQTALTLIEDSLTLTRAGAMDSILGFSLSLAGAIRVRNGDLPGALTVLQEATVQLYGDGNRLGLGTTLQRAAAVLARLAKPNRRRCWPEPTWRILRFPLSTFTEMSGSSSMKPRQPPAARSARPPTARRLGKERRWTTTRWPITRWVSSGGSSPCSRNPTRRHRINAGPSRASVSTSEPGGQSVAQSGIGAISHPGDVPVRADHHGGRGADGAQHRKLPRAAIFSIDQLDPVSPRRDVEDAWLIEVEQHRPGTVQELIDAERAIGGRDVQIGHAPSEQGMSRSEVVVDVETRHHAGDTPTRLVHAEKLGHGVAQGLVTVAGAGQCDLGHGVLQHPGADRMTFVVVGVQQALG